MRRRSDITKQRHHEAAVLRLVVADKRRHCETDKLGLYDTGRLRRGAVTKLRNEGAAIFRSEAAPNMRSKRMALLGIRETAEFRHR